MDRFKFRAWNPLLKEMTEPFHLIEVPKVLDHLMSIHYELDFGMPNAKFMQSTGLHDKHGKLIFEGDVVRVSCRGMKPWRDIVKYDESEMCGFSPMCDLDHEGFGSFLYEIIGNIYENPELLESED